MYLLGAEKIEIKKTWLPKNNNRQDGYFNNVYTFGYVYQQYVKKLCGDTTVD